LAKLYDPKRRQPLFNRAWQAAYPPGSTFKPFIALSALRRGMTTQERYWECPPWYQVPGTDDLANRKNNWTSADMGSMRLSRALVVSCDTVFYQLGYQYYREYRDRDQPTLLQEDLAAFGFSHNTGVDVPSESSGIIPDPEWKEVFYAERANEDSDGDGYVDDWANNWLPGDLLNMSIGQGDVTVTPLQLATGFSALANGGTVWRPHLALRIQAADGTVIQEIKPQATGRLPFSKKDLDYVREALRGVVGPEGTAYYAYRDFPLDRVPVAAKTGTAEVPPFEDYSWFAAMAPADHPQYVVVVMVEQGGHGSQTAAPITRRILEGLFDLPLSDIHVHRASD
jgi:penicillin-binding protein 2